MKKFVGLFFLLALFAGAVAAQIGQPQQVKKGGAFPPCQPATARLFIKSGSAAGVYYCSATNVWSPVGSVGAKKTAQAQTRNNSATLANDDALSFTVDANQTVAFRFKVFFTTPAVADFKFRLTGSNTPTNVNWAAISAASGTAGSVQSFTAFSAADVAVLGTGTGGFVIVEGVIQNSAPSCTVNFQWAQNTATVGDTRVLAGSSVEYVAF